MRQKIGILWLFFCSQQGFGSGVDLDQLLRNADLARSGSEEGMTWTVDILSHEQGVQTESSFLVKTRGDKALVEALSPARSKGELMLFQDRLLWFFKPGLSRPIALSTRQRLSGQAANGDIARTNYARDYQASLKGEETLAGVPCYVLELVAKAKDTTYDKISYWVSKATSQGQKARYKAIDGTALKNASFKYGTKMSIKGKAIDFIQEIRIEDAQSEQNFSIMKFKGSKLESHADALFNVNSLSR